jgi:hypothetical protein
VPSRRVLWILDLPPELNQYKILSPCLGKVLESLMEKHREILELQVSLPFSSLHEAPSLSMPSRLDILLVIIAWPMLLRINME